MSRKPAATASLLVLLTVATALAGCRKPPATSGPTNPPPPEEVLVETVPPPAPPPAPLSIPYKKLDTAKLFNGITLKTSFSAEFGATASAERKDPGSYELDLQLRVRVPKPHQSMEELLQLNPELGSALPELARLLENARVSPLYEEFYQRKVSSLQSNLTRLDTLLSRHNFFDIETILELESPLTGRRVLLIQSDMDVDTDGSDGDRVPTVEGFSSTFQPFTSYRWPKVTAKPNPFLTTWEKRLKEVEKELGTQNVPPPRQKELQDTRANLKTEITQLKKSSFLVGSVDPFVVLPLPIVSRKEGAPAAKIGDYCVVIHGGRLFPAVVGDAGPSVKSGEGSLRLCREISARANLANRAESDLKVTYLVFPNTAEPQRAAPALEKWWTQCDLLLGEIGGYRGELAYWEDLTKPKPTPPPWDPNFIGPSPEFYGPPPPR
jgi:hypothetical protein